ncbi:MAG: KAP family NTPase [Methanosarcina barkeri]|nr:KAP family NTPase [Methanosarcina sp. ERenArc_MAG2]
MSTCRKQVIRRLYYSIDAFKKSGIKFKPETEEQINKLHRMAIASKFDSSELSSQVSKLEEETIKEKAIDISFDNSFISIILFISWTLATVLEFKYITNNDLINKIIPLFFVYPIPFSVNAFCKRYFLSKKSDKMENKREELYHFDNSIGNLEFELENIHQSLIDEGKKLIYIIDELDKLEIEDVTRMLSVFKNLFNFSDSLFIFICGEEVYEKINGRQQDSFRPKEYTYFTSKYFIPRPLMGDIEDFLLGICEKDSNIESKDLKILVKALCFEAQNDFFDLKTRIKDRIDFNDSNKSIIEFDPKKYEDIQKARFQTLITSLFEEKYMSPSHSKWGENEELIREIYNHSYKIFTSYSQTEFKDPGGDSLKSELIRDFNSLLERCGAFSTLQEESIEIKNLPIKIVTYKYEGSIPEEPPSRLSSFTEYEKRFWYFFELYCDYLISVINAFEVTSGHKELNKEFCLTEPNIITQQVRKLGISEFNEFNQYYKVYMEGVTRKNLEKYRRDDMETMNKNIENAITVLFNTQIPRALVKGIKEKYNNYNLDTRTQSSKFLRQYNQKSNTEPNYRSFLQELNNFSFILLPKDKELLIGIDRKGVVKNFFSLEDDGNPENKISVFEIYTNKELPRTQMKFIKIDSPTNLKETIAKFLENIKEYMNNLQENEN